jgi:site-specific DNA recombinase|tara:strand:+ start:42 stop:1730 length:1689 start_codon:yes stop_codon:yes gene_type:complete
MSIILACYPRVSTKKQEDKDISIPGQIEAMRKYASQKGMVVVDKYIFADSKSAKDDNRPAFKEMIALGLKDKPPFQAILVWNVSRFCRNADDSVVYKTMLKKNGVKVISVEEEFPDGTMGWLMERFREVEDESFLHKTSASTVMNQNSLAYKGYWCNALHPYGYNRVDVLDGEKVRKKLAIDPVTMVVVKDIYDMADNGYSIVQIARKIGFSMHKIRNVLKNEHYLGNRVIRPRKDKFTYQKEPLIVIKNTHEAIISKQQWKRVQQKMKQRRKTKNDLLPGGHPVGNYVFTGLIKCQCGTSMIHQKSSVSARNPRPRSYYRCNNRATCNAPGLEEARLYNMVMEKLKADLFTDAALKRIATESEQRRSAASIATERDNTNAELQKVKTRKERLIDQIERGRLEQEEIDERLKAMQDEIAELKSKLDALVDNETPITVDAAKAAIRLIMAGLDGDSVERQMAMQSLIKKIQWNTPQVVIESKLLNYDSEFTLDYYEQPDWTLDVTRMTRDELIQLVCKTKKYTDDRSFTARSVKTWGRTQMEQYVFDCRRNKLRKDAYWSQQD